MSLKRCSKFFFIRSELQLFAKIIKDLVSTHSQKPGLSITHNLKKIKNPKNSNLDNGKKKTCAKFQQKKLNSMVVGARQSFHVFREISWFLGNKKSNK